MVYRHERAEAVVRGLLTAAWRLLCWLLRGCCATPVSVLFAGLLLAAHAYCLGLMGLPVGTCDQISFAMMAPAAKPLVGGPTTDDDNQPQPQEPVYLVTARTLLMAADALFFGSAGVRALLAKR